MVLGNTKKTYKHRYKTSKDILYSKQYTFLYPRYILYDNWLTNDIATSTIYQHLVDLLILGATFAGADFTPAPADTASTEWCGVAGGFGV